MCRGFMLPADGLNDFTEYGGSDRDQEAWPAPSSHAFLPGQERDPVEFDSSIASDDGSAVEVQHPFELVQHYRTCGLQALLPPLESPNTRMLCHYLVA